MNGSAKRYRTDWMLNMKLSEATVLGSTCIPALLTFKEMILAKKSKTASRLSEDDRTRALNIWKRDD